MARDYAKYRLQPKQKQTENGWRNRLLLSILIGCVVGLIIFGVYIYKNTPLESPRQKFATWVTQVKLFLSHKKTGASLLTKSPPMRQAKQEPEIRFNFYTELPNMQVTLPETEQVPSKQALTTKQNLLAATTKTEPLFPAKELKKNKNGAENAGQYILQMGVFKNETAAGQVRVSLLLAGFEADIVKSVDGNQTLYRIQKGPYMTLAQVKEVQKQLQSKGIMGLVKKL